MLDDSNRAEGNVDRMADLRAAQERVDALQHRGAAMNSQEARTAVNRLITLVRGATHEELKAFDAWKRDRQDEERTQ